MTDPERFALHRPELFGSLTLGESAIARAMAGSDKTYGSNQTLIQAGEDHQFVYRLLEGWVGRVRRMSDGRDQFILIFLPGELFAVKSMFVRHHPDAVQTLSECRIERIQHRQLLSLYRENPDVSIRCTWQVVEEERRLHSWVVGLGQGSAEERLALLMLDLHRRLHATGHLDDEWRFRLPLTQSQIADHLGITAIHVNRVLRVFRENGLMVVKDGVVAIHDPHRLLDVAEPLMDPYDSELARRMAPRRTQER